MPMMKMRRNFRLASTKGHSVQFLKDQPTWVPPVLVADAVGVGAEGVDEDIDLTPPEAPKVNTGPTDAQAREDQILEAINQVISANDRESFTAGGQPKANAITALLGYKVDKREVETVFLKRAEMIVAGIIGHDGSKG